METADKILARYKEITGIHLKEAIKRKGLFHMKTALPLVSW